jgi:hypothetical protein
MYYIYHIPGVKVGCSMYPKRRVKVQGYDTFEILEQHLDIDIAAEREVQLTKQYGYSLDNCKYNQTNYSEMGKIAGNLAVKRGTIEKARLVGYKIAAALPRSDKQLESMEKARLIGAPIAWSLPRSEKQMAMYTAPRTEKQLETSIINGKIQGAICAQSGHMHKMGKLGGATNVQSGHIQKLSNINNNKIRICPYCNTEIKGIGYFRWHGENCKHK